MSMITSQIKYVDLSKLQKSKYLKTFFVQMKKCIHYTIRAIIWQTVF